MKHNDLNEGDQLPAAERIAYLIAGYLANTLTEAEHDELDDWVVASEENTKFFEELTDEDNIEAGIRWHQNLERQKALQKIKEDLGLRRAERPFFRSFWPYLVAACLLLSVAGIYLLKTAVPKKITPALVKNNGVNAIHPGQDQAVLTLANGRTIILDSTGTGLLATEGSVHVSKQRGGEILYSGNDKNRNYNIVSTPRGGQYKLVLGDGTRVWLNAESSLKFPAGFAPHHRDVELQGEAYFEVAKNPAQPFKVTIKSPSGNGGTVEVLGTHFNINSYGEEATVKTTLLEGSVQVEREGKRVVLKPGQQAQSGIGINVIMVNPEEAVAWKNGLFLFRDAPIYAIGAQISRWYNLDVEYRGSIPYHFNAAIDRKEPLAQLLNLLAGTKQVHFSVENKKLIISP